MPYIDDISLDALLSSIQSRVTTLFITSAEATTYAQASATYKLGTKAGPAIGAPADRAPNGRKATVAAITDGVVNSTGNATHWALCSAGALIATGLLSASQAVTAGNVFTLPAFDVGVPDAV